MWPAFTQKMWYVARGPKKLPTPDLEQSLEQKFRNEKLYPGIVACAVIPPMGGWTLRNGRLIKSCNMVLNEL